MGIVYKIECVFTGRFYIGSTSNLKRRLYEHFGKLKRNKHYSSKMQDDFNEYGEKAFIVTVLEECDLDIRRTREQYWIDILNPVDNGYNQSHSAFTNDCSPALIPKYGKDNSFYGKHHTAETKAIISAKARMRTGWKHTDEYKQLMSKKQQGGSNSHARRVIQYDLNMNYIRTWDCVEDAVKYHSIKSKSSIVNACLANKNRTSNYRSGKGFIWMYESEVMNDGNKDRIS